MKGRKLFTKQVVKIWECKQLETEYSEKVRKAKKIYFRINL